MHQIIKFQKTEQVWNMPVSEKQIFYTLNKNQSTQVFYIFNEYFFSFGVTQHNLIL